MGGRRGGAVRFHGVCVCVCVCVCVYVVAPQGIANAMMGCSNGIKEIDDTHHVSEARLAVTTLRTENRSARQDSGCLNHPHWSHRRRQLTISSALNNTTKRDRRRYAVPDAARAPDQPLAPPRPLRRAR